MGQTEHAEAALADLLRWYGEMGVDAAVDAQPHDRFAECAALAERAVPAAAAPLRAGSASARAP